MRQLKFVVCHTIHGPGRYALYPESWLIPRTAVYGILVKHGKVLLVTCKSTGLFWFPGGGMEPGETVAQAMAREGDEETGVSISAGELMATRHINIVYNPTHTDFFEANRQKCLFYQCFTENTLTKSDDEVDDIEASKPRWVDIKTLTPESFQNMGDLVIALIQECHDLNSSPVP